MKFETLFYFTLWLYFILKFIISGLVDVAEVEGMLYGSEHSSQFSQNIIEKGIQNIVMTSGDLSDHLEEVRCTF